MVGDRYVEMYLDSWHRGRAHGRRELYPDFPCEGRHNKEMSVCNPREGSMQKSIVSPDLGFPASRAMRSESLQRARYSARLLYNSSLNKVKEEKAAWKIA